MKRPVEENRKSLISLLLALVIMVSLLNTAGAGRSYAFCERRVQTIAHVAKELSDDAMAGERRSEREEERVERTGSSVRRAALRRSRVKGFLTEGGCMLTVAVSRLLNALVSSSAIRLSFSRAKLRSHVSIISYIHNKDGSKG